MSNTKKAARPNELEPAAKATAETEATGRQVAVTYEGHDYEFDLEAMNDLLLMDDIADIDDGKAYKMPRVIRRLIGQEQWDQFVERHADEKGRVSADHAMKLFEQLNEASGN